METSMELQTQNSTTAALTARSALSPLSSQMNSPAFEADSWFDAGFLPDRDTLVSFLMNALYLFGDQGIATYGEFPGRVTAELTRLGHAVAAGRIVKSARGNRAGNAGPRRAGGGLPQPVREGGSDRAVFLTGALGQGDDARILETLKAMRRTVRPGGLLCFHVFDRDRAWGLVGERALDPVAEAAGAEAAGGKSAGLETARAKGDGARVRVGFAPETGRLTARIVGTGDGVAAAAGSAASIKTWNLGEIPALLRAAGLVLERAYGDWHGAGPETGGAETGRLILVAARPRTARSGNGRRVGNRPGTGRKGEGP
jgi:hypothetical protein